MSHVKGRMAAMEGISDVHDLHVWQVSTGIPILTAHIHMDGSADAAEVGGRGCERGAARGCMSRPQTSAWHLPGAGAPVPRLPTGFNAAAGARHGVSWLLVHAMLITSHV